MRLVITEREREHAASELWRVSVLDEDGRQLSWAKARTVETRYDKAWLKALLIGGVETKVEHRRRGCVRFLLNELLKMQPEAGWSFSMMHPFSFSYYRQFGYERIADHRILEIPIETLGFVERSSRLEEADPAENSRHRDDLVKLFDRFTEDRPLSLRRLDEVPFLRPEETKKSIYILYRNGEPAGYISFGITRELMVNHYINTVLHVYEIVYLSREALFDLLGFIRLFDGETERVKFHNIAFTPEVEGVLREYVRADIRILPDIAGRILDLGPILSARRYPERPGTFVLRVEDALPGASGVWRVEYSGGDASVSRLKDDAAWDISSPCCSLLPILFGTDAYDAPRAAYLPGFETRGSAEDFFRAFPRRYAGIYEHF